MTIVTMAPRSPLPDPPRAPPPRAARDWAAALAGLSALLLTLVAAGLAAADRLGRLGRRTAPTRRPSATPERRG